MAVRTSAAVLFERMFACAHGVKIVADGTVPSVHASRPLLVPSDCTTLTLFNPRTASSMDVASLSRETPAVTSPCGELNSSGTASMELVAGFSRRWVPARQFSFRFMVASGAPSCTVLSTRMYSPPAIAAFDSGGTGTTGWASL